MAFDGCFHDTDIDLSTFPQLTDLAVEPPMSSQNSIVPEAPLTLGTRLRKTPPLRHHLQLLMSNSYMIDSYSRILFPLAYLTFNIIYWSIYT